MPPLADAAPTRFVRAHLSRIAPGQPVPWPVAAIVITGAVILAAVAAAIVKFTHNPDVAVAGLLAYLPAYTIIGFHCLGVRHRGWAVGVGAVAVGVMAVLSDVVPTDWTTYVKCSAIAVGMVAYLVTTHLPARPKPVAPAVSWSAETGRYTPDR